MLRHRAKRVFIVCKLRVCPLFEISTIDQPLFRGWGPPVRGGIVIWLARALRALGTRQHVIRLFKFKFKFKFVIFPKNTSEATHFNTLQHIEYIQVSMGSKAEKAMLILQLTSGELKKYTHTKERTIYET